jgi:D-alanyl-D-alanine carboxypeptidase (penicillin-binding protein 5/6)
MRRAMKYRLYIQIILIVLAIFVAIRLGAGLAPALEVKSPTPTPTIPPPTPTPIPPTPILTVEGKPPTVSATAAYLLDEDTGNTLADINGEEPLPMASTTKIMAAILAIQAGDLNSLVVIHQDAVDEVILNQGSSAQLIAGDRIRLIDLLYALLVPSGDDAAIAIADAVGGSEQNFVRMMNITANRLHLFQTHYANPDGLPVPDHYSSAYDLVRLAQYAMTIPLFAQIVQTQEYSIPMNGLHHGYVWKTTNTLLGTYKGATGIKTGTTLKAGYCLVFSATRDGHHLIGVVLHSTSEQSRFADAKALLDWGFGLPLLVPAP